MCAVRALARDMHFQHVVLKRTIDFRKHKEIEIEAGCKPETVVTWRDEDRLFYGMYEDVSENGVKHNGKTFFDKCEGAMSKTEFKPLFSSDAMQKHDLSDSLLTKTYFCGAATTNALERSASDGTCEGLRKIGGWLSSVKKKNSVFKDSYLHGVDFRGLTAAAGGVTWHTGVVSYVLELNRDTLRADEALIQQFTNGLVNQAEELHKAQRQQ